MERLNLEQLARLVDEQPTPEEQKILDADPRLRRELEALKTQSWSLSNLPALLPPPGGWHQLEKALSKAGLVHGQSTLAVWRKWMQVAAAVVVFVGGTTVGWVTARASQSQAPAGAGAAAAAHFGQPASLEEATAMLELKEREFREAVADYWRLAEAGAGLQAGQNPAARLPYIRAFQAAANVAVEANPGDPFFNSALVQVMAEQEQVIRMISQDNWN